MTEVRSVSISDPEIIKWFEDLKKSKDRIPSLSLTLRDALIEKKRSWEILNEEGEGHIKELRKKVEYFSSRFQNVINFLEEKELSEKFLEWEKRIIKVKK